MKGYINISKALHFLIGEVLLESSYISVPMMIFIFLICVVILTLLSLYFMREAIEQQEFSLMWAGLLMAAGTVGVYLVAGNYAGYMMRSHDQVAIEQAYDSIRWYVETEEASEPQVYVSDAVMVAPTVKTP